MHNTHFTFTVPKTEAQLIAEIGELERLVEHEVITRAEAEKRHQEERKALLLEIEGKQTLSMMTLGAAVTDLNEKLEKALSERDNLYYLLYGVAGNAGSDEFESLRSRLEEVTAQRDSLYYQLHSGGDL